MFYFQFSFSEQWLGRQRRQERQELRYEWVGVSDGSEGISVQVIAAEGEHKASSALAQAALVIEESPHALQVCKRFIIMTMAN